MKTLILICMLLPNLALAEPLLNFLDQTNGEVEISQTMQRTNENGDVLNSFQVYEPSASYTTVAGSGRECNFSANERISGILKGTHLFLKNVDRPSGLSGLFYSYPTLVEVLDANEEVVGKVTCYVEGPCSMLPHQEKYACAGRWQPDTVDNYDLSEVLNAMNAKTPTRPN